MYVYTLVILKCHGTKYLEKIKIILGYSIIRVSHYIVDP